MTKTLLSSLCAAAIAVLPVAGYANEWDDMKKSEANLQQKAKAEEQQGQQLEKRGADLEQRGEKVRNEGEQARDTGVRDYHTGQKDLRSGVDTTEQYEKKVSSTVHRKHKSTASARTTKTTVSQ